MKKMKKYRDQDEEEREMRMQLLQVGLYLLRFQVFP